MRKSILPFFHVTMEHAAAKRRMLETYFGIHFRQRHPNMGDEIDGAFDTYALGTVDRFPFTARWLIAHFTYMRAPLVKIGPAQERKSLPYLIGRGKHAQFNDDSDEKYVVAAMMCDRVLTCDEGMKNILEAIKASGCWAGEVIY